MASTVASSSRVPSIDASPKIRSKNSSSKDHKNRNISKERSKNFSRVNSNTRSSKDDTVLEKKDGWKGRKVSGPKESAFRRLDSIIDISIPPALMNNYHRAAAELMDTLLMRYVPQLSGVLLSHDSINYLRPCAKIDSDGAYAISPAQVSCLVWAPEIGMRLEGQIQLSTPSHISLLVHGIFNASITSAHLPSNFDQSRSSKDTVYQWHEFENGEENVVRMEDVKNEDDIPNESLADDVAEKSTGYWVNKETKEILGGKDGKVVFTVVGMTVAHHMLSVFGSLLRKPFSIAAPTFVPKPTTISSILTENARKVHFQEGHQSRTFPANGENEEDEGDSDDDEIPSTNIISRPEVITEDATTKKKKKRSKVGPRREGDTTSGSESEGEAKRDRKKRKKE